MTVISLSTIPSRFGKIGPTLECLLAQKADISEIRLVLPKKYRRFPDYDGTVPPLPAGITVKRPDTDIGPASKVLFTARDLRGTNQSLIFCDDDREYTNDWAAELVSASEKRPNFAICVTGWFVTNKGFQRKSKNAFPAPRKRLVDLEYRMRRLSQQIVARELTPPYTRPPRRPFASSGQVDIFAGFGGVLVQPDWFDDSAFEIPPVVWAVDDIWLSGHLARRDIPIWVEAGLYLPPPSDAARIDALQESQVEGYWRNAASHECISYLRKNYKIWL